MEGGVPGGQPITSYSPLFSSVWGHVYMNINLLNCFETFSNLVPHSQQVSVTGWLRCVRLEVESELKMVSQFFLRRGLVLVQQDRVMVAALESPLVGLHPAGWVLLLQQIPSRPWLAILVEWNPVDRTLHSGIADACWYVYTRQLELTSSPSRLQIYEMLVTIFTLLVELWRYDIKDQQFSLPLLWSVVSIVWSCATGSDDGDLRGG